MLKRMERPRTEMRNNKERHASDFRDRKNQRSPLVFDPLCSEEVGGDKARKR